MQLTVVYICTDAEHLDCLCGKKQMDIYCTYECTKCKPLGSSPVRSQGDSSEGGKGVSDSVQCPTCNGRGKERVHDGSQFRGDGHSHTYPCSNTDCKDGRIRAKSQALTGKGGE